MVAWGALAFGAVYPWAYWPLLAACACIGTAAVLVYRRRPFDRPLRRVLLALGAVVTAVALQLVPLPAGAVAAVSPATDAFLERFNLAYALDEDVWHPLSIAPAATVPGLALLTAFALFLAGLTRALSSSRVRRLAALIVAFGVALALIGIVQKAVAGDHAWAGMKIYGFWTPANLLSTPFGPYVNKNHFAGWMLMVIPLAIGLAIGRAEQALGHAHGGWRGALLWLSSPAGGRVQLLGLAALVMGASLLLTRSRSGVSCLVLALLLLGVAAKRRFGSARATAAAAGALAVLFVALFLLAGADLTARITNRMDAMELRKNIWTDSAAIVRDFPLTGTGLNTFGTAMIRYQTSQDDQHFQEAHNDYLQIAVEGGLLVGLPVLLACIAVGAAIRQRFAAAADDAVTYWVRTGATVGILAVAAQSFVEFSLQMPGNAAVFVVLLAMVLHEATSRRRSEDARSGSHS